MSSDASISAADLLGMTIDVRNEVIAFLIKRTITLNLADPKSMRIALGIDTGMWTLAGIFRFSRNLYFYSRHA